VGLLACVIAGCAGHHQSSPAPGASELDAGHVPDVLDDSPLDAGGVVDPSTPIPVPHEAGTADPGARDAAPGEDASLEPRVFEAVRGQRCKYTEYIGSVRIVNDPSTFEGLTASAVLFDGRIELAPELATEHGACGFYRPPATSCEEDCAAQQLGCGRNGTCGSWLPDWREDVRLTLSNGLGSQILDGSGGAIHEVTLEGALSVRLEFDHYTVTLGSTPIPAPLVGLDVTFHGPEDARQSADVSWAEPADGQVLAFAILERGTPLDPFTECVADGSALSFAIEKDVLEPFLTISAFQANVVDHAHVAAANTPVGCIEIRYAHRHGFTP
jgi:hypothetical protein